MPPGAPGVQTVSGSPTFAPLTPKLYPAGTTVGHAWLELPRFPGWATIPSHYSLAGARHWHLFFALVLGFGLLAYMIIGLINRHIQRDLRIRRRDLATLRRDRLGLLVDHLERYVATSTGPTPYPFGPPLEGTEFEIKADLVLLAMGFLHPEQPLLDAFGIAKDQRGNAKAPTYATSEDGVLAAIRGDEADPFSRGHVCPKGNAILDLEADPDRLTAPMRRVGSDWEAIGWDEAFAIAGERLAQVQREHGAGAVAAYLGNPNVHHFGHIAYLPALLKLLRTPNLFSASSVDQWPHQYVHALMYGHQWLLPIPDLDRTDFLLMLGANPVASNGSLMTAPGMPRRLKAIAARGSVVLLDASGLSRLFGSAQELGAVQQPGQFVAADAQQQLLVAGALPEGPVLLADLRQRLKDLPDQEDELLSYLPSCNKDAPPFQETSDPLERETVPCSQEQSAWEQYPV